MARKLGVNDIKKDLVKKYVYKGKAGLDSVAKTVYQMFYENLEMDKPGAYSAAFRSAEDSGLITKRPNGSLLERGQGRRPRRRNRGRGGYLQMILL